MDPNDPRFGFPPPPQSIPLRNLSRTSEATNDGERWTRRPSDDHAAAAAPPPQPFPRRPSRHDRPLFGNAIPHTNHDHLSPQRANTSGQHPYQSETIPYEDGELSPLNMADFHAATTGFGPLDACVANPRPGLNTMQTPSIMYDEVPTYSATPTPADSQRDQYFAPSNEDNIPLNDPRYSQPISGSPYPAALGTGDVRQRNGSTGVSGRMLGDDLEPGFHLRRRSNHSSNHSRSISEAASPLLEAGDILRKMSQRVVNLSNEPEVVDATIRRSNSHRGATMDAPPSFPAMAGYAHDEPTSSSTPSPPEKDQRLPPMRRDRTLQDANPLKGRSLGIFSPGSRVRRWLCEVLVHPVTEPLILVLILLQAVVLSVDSAATIPPGELRPRWTESIVGWILVVLFALYTAEIVAKIIVSGFIKNPYEYSTLPHGLTIWQRVRQNLTLIFGPPKIGTRTPMGVEQSELQPSIVRSFTALQDQPKTKGHSRQAQRVRLARRAFLRHSFNRIDAMAVVSFWIAIVLSITDYGQVRHIYVFQMVSSLRILRLLSLTSGTSVILRSLKKAAPLLVNVAFLIGFFWLLFGIVGVQSFKSSLQRTCLWLGVENATTFVETNNSAVRESLINQGFDQNNTFGSIVQFCGGSLSPNGTVPIPYFTNNFVPRGSPKGYWCPAGSICLQQENPYNNSISFDNIANSLELVFVVLSSNTFTDLLYYTTNTDSLAGSVFFIFGIIIMTFWLINLLIAVITSSFQVIREESKASAFGADEQPVILEKEDHSRRRRTRLKKLFDKTYWFWIAVIVFDLVVQAIRTSQSSNATKAFIMNTETVVTIILLVEIGLRFAVDWRGFHRSKKNWFDLFLAITSFVILFPPIRNSLAYPALTIFEILRVYRVVIAIPFVRDLVLVVLGNVSGILNLIIFVFLVTYLGAIFAAQLLRGEIPQYDSFQNFVRVPFTNLFNSFLGMYQVLSSENWTAVMYAATAFEEEWRTAWISAAFFILWFIFSDFIILNMFIAVIQENFDVSEDEKRLHQVRAFLQQKELTGSVHSNLSLAAIFQFRRSKSRRQDPTDFGPATIEMFKDTVVRDFLDEQMEALDKSARPSDTNSFGREQSSKPNFFVKLWKRIVQRLGGGDPNPFYSDLAFSKPYEELDPRSMAQEIVSAAEQRKRAQRQYLADHPRYDVSLFIFSHQNPLRRFCQSLVGPGRGSKRFHGNDPVKARWYTFSIFIYACIISMVVLACIATPLYQKGYIAQYGGINNWFVVTDLIFASIFTLEAAIKMIADGLFFTPNAYLRGAWGLIDAVVLITLWISVIAAFENSQNVARVIGAFKALRALRLLNVSDSARDTFHSIIVRGAWKLISAAFVSLSLLVPFAIYGLNIFNGRMLQCNDQNNYNTDINLLQDCVGEYNASPFEWNFPAPRQVNNQYFNFDNFGNSLFILFQIVSQEGWVDVMWAAISARQVGQQPIQNFNPPNGLFFVVFNLLGTVFILTLFVSIFMRNYTEQTGVAFLTSDQRSWLELRKLLRQISPSKRPTNPNRSKFANWCYRRAIKKHGKWHRLITFVLILHVLLLASEFNPEPPIWETIRLAIFSGFLALYLANIVIRIVGLTWERFRRSSWDLFSLIIVGATTILTALNFAYSEGQETIVQLQKLLLAFISLLLIPRNNQLDQLFKTAAASFGAISSLILTWFVIYLVFAIAMTQTLGLTRFGSLGQANLNFRTVVKALILLFRMSCGEGWNQIMSDYANAVTPNCVQGDSFFNSDCGSENWARFLFVSWNIVSMYIFTSMFVSLIFESFSYVYQQSNGLSMLSREEIRRFKQAWATFDPDGTGFISKEAFPKLLGELSGIFSLRIYDGDHTVQRILEDCRVEVRGNDPIPGVVAGIDLYRLNQRLRTIDVQEVRRRRLRLMIFSQEILVSADPDRGVSFQSVLLILAHYNVIKDSKSLRLEEFLRRRYRLQRVEEEVQRRIVIGFFDTLFWSRQFRRRRELRDSARMVGVPQFSIPEIWVDDQDQAHTPPTLNLPKPTPIVNIEASPPSILSPGSDISPTAQVPVRGRGWNIRSSPTRGGPSSPQFMARVDGPGDVDPQPMLLGDSGDEGYIRGRHGSNASPQGRSPPRSPGLLSPTAPNEQRGSRRQHGSRGTLSPLESFDNSAWGESIRRSFTLSRRQGGRGSRSDSPPE